MIGDLKTYPVSSIAGTFLVPRDGLYHFQTEGTVQRQVVHVYLKRIPSGKTEDEEVLMDLSDVLPHSSFDESKYLQRPS